MCKAASFILLAILAAETAPARADDACAPLREVNAVQMIHLSSSVDLVPVSISGVRKVLLFDTAGSYTSIRKSVADDLKLATHQSSSRGIIDMLGQSSFEVATLPQFQLGQLKGDNINVMIATNLESLTTEGADGIYAFDLMGAYDLDVDFRSDTLNFFSPDHCPGAPWKAPAMAVLPMTMDGYHITVPVTLDGHDFNAVIDTGSENTSLQMRAGDLQSLYGVSPGTPDTPEAPPVNGSVKAWRHTFKRLALGDVAITAPQVTIVSQDSPAGMIIGMDVLRKLHLYMAPKEKKLYISSASAPQPEP